MGIRRQLDLETQWNKKSIAGFVCYIQVDINILYKYNLTQICANFFKSIKLSNSIR